MKKFTGSKVLKSDGGSTFYGFTVKSKQRNIVYLKNLETTVCYYSTLFYKFDLMVQELPNVSLHHL